MPGAATAENATSTETRNVTLRITLPASALEEYEAQAKSHHLEVEDVMAARLLACIDHTSGKPLYFSDAQRQQLDTILGRNVRSTADALNQIQHVMQVKIDKVAIPLKLNLLQKLKSRCLGMTWPKFLEQLITQELERHVGLR